ncbi:MAG: hypothetical protein ACRCVT_00900 [Leadbetterella sp.]
MNIDQEYNATFIPEQSEDAYSKILKAFEKQFPDQLEFRIAESPLFIDKDLKISLLQAGNEVISQLKNLLGTDSLSSFIPTGFPIANPSKHPECLAIDFAISQNDAGVLEPKLIELQGFPSVFAYQSFLISQYRKHHAIQNKWSSYFNRTHQAEFTEAMRTFILGGYEAQNTVLLELDPQNQRTKIDFSISEALWGVPTVDLNDITQDNKKLFYWKDEKKIPIHRIYNRVIPTEFFKERKDIDWSVCEVEWVCHPAWYFIVSKAILPAMKGKYVPQSYYVNFEVKDLDIDTFVMKPIFSFGSKGVIIRPTWKDVNGIEEDNTHILQERVTYADIFTNETEDAIKAEIRLLYIWPPNQKHPKLMLGIPRLSKSGKIGMSDNENKKFTGASALFFASE